MVTGGNIDLRIEDLRIVHVDDAVICLFHLNGEEFEILTGEEADGLFCGTIEVHGAFHADEGDVGIAIDTGGVGGPELDLSAGFHIDSDASGNQQRVFNDVIIVGGQGHIAGDLTLENGATLNRAGKDGIKLLCIYRSVTGVQGIGRGVIDAEGQMNIVGCCFGNGNTHRIGYTHNSVQFVINKAVILLGEGTNVIDPNGISGYIGNIRIDDATFRGGADNDIHIGSCAPLVSKAHSDVNRFAGLYDAITVVLLGNVSRIEDIDLVDINIGTGFLQQAVSKVGLGISKFQIAGKDGGEPQNIIGRTGDLTHDISGRIDRLIRIGAADNGSHGGYHRRSHGSAAPGGVAITGQGTVHIHAGCNNFVLCTVIGFVVPVGEVSQFALGVGGHNTDHIGVGGGIHIAAGREGCIQSGVAVVTGCGNQHAGTEGILEGSFNDSRMGIGTKGHIDNIRTILVGIFDGLCDIGGAEAAVRLTGLDCHDLCVIGNTYTTNIVVGHGDNAGHMGAVAIVVHGIAGAINKGNTVDIVDIAVVVIVNAFLTLQLSSVDPHVVLQIFVAVVYARVDDSNNNAFTGGIAIGGIVSPDGDHILILQVPLAVHTGIILGRGRVTGVEHIVRLRYKYSIGVIDLIGQRPNVITADLQTVGNTLNAGLGIDGFGDGLVADKTFGTIPCFISKGDRAFGFGSDNDDGIVFGFHKGAIYFVLAVFHDLVIIDRLVGRTDQAAGIVVLNSGFLIDLDLLHAGMEQALEPGKIADGIKYLEESCGADGQNHDQRHGHCNCTSK